MLDAKGKRRCDREVGSPARGWRSCMKLAENEHRTRYGTLLDFCNKHYEAGKRDNP